MCSLAYLFVIMSIFLMKYTLSRVLKNRSTDLDLQSPAEKESKEDAMHGGARTYGISISPAHPSVSLLAPLVKPDRGRGHA
jgi:hypothetical protein